MLELYQQFLLPLFFKTEEKSKLVNKITLYVTKEVVSYIEAEDGSVKKEISKIESPSVIIYEGKVTLDPHKIREIMSDPINFPTRNPEDFEKAISIEQKDMISTVYEMINTSVNSFTASYNILLNSIGFFF